MRISKTTAKGMILVNSTLLDSLLKHSISNSSCNSCDSFFACHKHECTGLPGSRSTSQIHLLYINIICQMDGSAPKIPSLFMPWFGPVVIVTTILQERDHPASSMDHQSFVLPCSEAYVGVEVPSCQRFFALLSSFAIQKGTLLLDAIKGSPLTTTASVFDCNFHVWQQWAKCSFARPWNSWTANDVGYSLSIKKFSSPTFLSFNRRNNANVFH